MKKTKILIVIIVLVVAGLVIFWQFKNQEKISVVNSAENTENTSSKEDSIRLTSPQPNAVIKSPLVITGEARGSWFFEGQFPIELRIPSKPPQAIITSGVAYALSDWTTNDFVPFTATLTFKNPTTSFDDVLNPEQSLILELKKDNPSGLPQNDDSIDISVTLKR